MVAGQSILAMLKRRVAGSIAKCRMLDLSLALVALAGQSVHFLALALVAGKKSSAWFMVKSQSVSGFV